ncbi:Mu transposase C-terminal domain-containing protein [Aquipseudomonas alcaligenes]|uniref:Mu transposase C-terminal domain-containing protein n=1 Tax=Pseudomonas sp. 2023EL-01195 TaxID=3088134 RepID=UPI00296AC4DD|nr:Mu transposase C-terminal domain-containing protein [Pseudomonas sp. 2023EL-01195]MDW3714894.1 Mu transposase C-terminal domain-containing protein [Pseudomonas sp. 2023EL-01195]
MSDGAKPVRSMISLDKDSLVEHHSGTYRIVQTLNFNDVVGVHIETGISSVLGIQDLRPAPQDTKGLFVSHDLEDIGDENWKLAEHRYSVIEPLLSGNHVVKGAVAARAKEAGVDAATVYRWLGRYQNYGNISALVPMRRGWAKGRSRISTQVEKLIDDILGGPYSENRGITIKDAHESVKEACKALGIPAPNITTVRSRIKKLPLRKLYLSRGQVDKARAHEARSGGLEADYPLQIVQIDHTPLDVFLVDDIHRESIGRPWVTLAICVYTRMVVGYYFSLEAPSALSVAMCIVNTCLPKESLLARHGLHEEWPVWGKPSVIHSDNGSDFRTGSLIKSCAMHGIAREFRPLESPHWGGHIERLMGTLAIKSKKEKGATQSSPKDRKGYDAEKEAVYTFDDYETRLIRRILAYNNEYHEAIQMAPINKWRSAFFGDRKICDPLARIADPFIFQLDFLPSEMRTIQNKGVEWDAHYFCDAMRPWVGIVDEKTKKSKKFIVRRDPRDVRRIWFYEPNLKEYFEAPIDGYIENRISVREYVAAKRQARRDGLENVNTALLEQLAVEDRKQELEAAAKTKTARRNAQRVRNDNKSKKSAPVDSAPARQSATGQSSQKVSKLVPIDQVEDLGGVDFGL